MKEQAKETTGRSVFGSISKEEAIEQYEYFVKIGDFTGLQILTARLLMQME